MQRVDVGAVGERGEVERREADAQVDAEEAGEGVDGRLQPRRGDQGGHEGVEIGPRQAVEEVGGCAVAGEVVEEVVDFVGGGGRIGGGGGGGGGRGDG